MTLARLWLPPKTTMYVSSALLTVEAADDWGMLALATAKIEHVTIARQIMAIKSARFLIAYSSSYSNRTNCRIH